MLKIDKLTAKIGERKILDKFNIEIKDGEIFCQAKKFRLFCQSFKDDGI